MLAKFLVYFTQDVKGTAYPTERHTGIAGSLDAVQRDRLAVVPPWAFALGRSILEKKAFVHSKSFDTDSRLLRIVAPKSYKGLKKVRL